MPRKISKKQLLNTQMHKLGLPSLVTKHFFDAKYDKEEDVLMLKEFFELNHELFTNKTAFFTKKDQVRRFRNNYSHNEGFLKTSKTWHILKDFLLKHNFTHRDCLHLLDKESSGVQLLSKKQILSLPVEVMFTRPVFYQIIEYLYGQEPVSDYYKDKSSYDRAMRNYAKKYHGTTVAQIIALTGKDVNNIFKKEDSFWRQYRISLHNIQKKFKGWGLTKKDGPFMGLYLYPTCHTKKEFMTYLITEKGFTAPAANLALVLGMEAGWVYWRK